MFTNFSGVEVNLGIIWADLLAYLEDYDKTQD